MATAYKLDDDLNARVERLADRRGLSAESVLREAVVDFVIRAEARESFLREAEEALEHYERTGLHITFEELEAWLSTWGTDHEKAAPDCHE